MAQGIADKTAADRVPVRELGREEGLQLLHENAQHYLGISGEEFLRRWDAGVYKDGDRDRNVLLVASLLPFVR